MEKTKADAPIPRITFASASYDMGPLSRALEAAQPCWSVKLWPEPGWEQADVAVCWDTPEQLYAQMPNLRLIHGIAAGVDNIIRENTRGTPVCRVVDPNQIKGMVEYVLWSVLYFHRGFDTAARQQTQVHWQRPVLRAAHDFRVGVAGLGAMGMAVAQSLVAQGYEVSGFSRTPRQANGIACYHGPDQLKRFLSALDLVICVLPLTPETRGILSREFFDALPRNAALVHVGRGEHLDADALRDALACGHLRGAVVDVFPREPLEASSAMWETPGLVVTPHMATMASPKAIIEQIILNVQGLESDRPISNNQGLEASTLSN